MKFTVEFIQSLLAGFGIFILATSFIHSKNEKSNTLIMNLTDSATLIVRFGSIGYLLIWLTDLYIRFENEDYYSLQTRLFGAYWFGYWIYPICYGLIPQLFWIKKIRKTKTVRICVALAILFALFLARLIIMITALHRDYVPSGWAMLPDYAIIYDWLLSLVIFSLSLAFVHLVKLKLPQRGKT